MRIIDRFLNRFTMCRLTLYYLIALLELGLVLSFLGTLPGGPLAIVSSSAVHMIVCHFANLALARMPPLAAHPHSPRRVSRIKIAISQVEPSLWGS